VAVDNRASVSVDHYENFPVASWLCPPALRPAVVAIYHFARTADDIADEGDADAGQRLADMEAFQAELRRAAMGQPAGPRWPAVFAPLSHAIDGHGLPVPLLEDLLDAFTQDIHNPGYPTRAAVLDYCRRSANPIGRLLLHLYGIRDAEATMQSDAICSALQLANFWQDLSVDLARGRCYVPVDDATRHGLTREMLTSRIETERTRALVADLCEWTRTLMESGAPLVYQIPGRAGWELRLVVQGGLRILDKIGRIRYATLYQRPTIGAADALPIAWHALRMRQAPRRQESAA
jgi:hydroxysqualene synthase